MRYLNKINNTARQRFFLTGNEGQRIQVNMRYLPTQQSWIIDVVYGSVSIKGIRIVNSPNILRKFRNVIPFGISCIVEDGLDPYYIDDFSSQRAVLYLLDESDVALVESEIYA